MPERQLTTQEVLDVLQFKDFELLFLVLSGSHAYGLSRPESDYDYRGIGIPDLEYFFTTKTWEQAQDKGNDITIFSIMKFFELARNVNPNIVELLFIDPNDPAVMYLHPIMIRIIQNRHLFLSKKAEHSFSGYAFAQLKRIKSHKKWIDHPVTRPTREQYGLPVMPLFDKTKIKGLSALGNDVLSRVRLLGEMDTGAYVSNEVAYHQHVEAWKRYDGWRKNRNEKRAALEEKAGYDTKHAMHLMRLMHMAREIATEGKIYTRRTYDKDFLNDIRDGKYGYEEILNMAEKEEKELHDLFKESDLPYSVDNEAIDDLLYSILKEHFNITEF